MGSNINYVPRKVTPFRMHRRKLAEIVQSHVVPAAYGSHAFTTVYSIDSHQQDCSEKRAKTPVGWVAANQGNHCNVEIFLSQF